MDQAKLGPLRAGDTFLGKYEVRSLLGKGGHAFVYEAYDPFLDRSVAIKVVKSPKDAGRDLGKRARSEAQVLSRVDHKNLVKVLDAGISEGLVYLIMEKLDGRTLRDALRDLQRLSVAEALTVGLQVAEGMEVAHREQVVHRDLKPENIFIEAGNALKVLDFGIAKVLGMAGHPDTTQKDLLQGTVLYMSPEHLQGISVTPRSDVYALGTILFEALYAHPLAIGEKPAGLQEAAWMQIAKVPPMLDELDATIPRFVSRLIHRAIVKIPEQRYPNMREFRDALELGLTRLRAERTSHPTQQALRDLSVSAPPLDQARSPRDTVRAEAVLTSQVTVAAHHDRGDTEAVSRLPFTLSPESAAAQGYAPHPRDDRTPLVYGTVSAAPPPAQPAPFGQPGSVPVTLPLVANHAQPPAHAAAPFAHAQPQSPPAVSPSTAPPVSSRIGPQPIKLPTPLHKDRGVRVAVAAAVLVGVVGGTAFGILAPRTTTPDPATAASSAPALELTPEPPAVVNTTPASTPVDDAAPPPPSASASAVSPPPTPSSPAVASRPVAPRAAPTATGVGSGLDGDSAAQARAAKSSSSAKAPTPRATATSELEQRLDWLDRDSKSSAPAKKKTSL